MINRTDLFPIGIGTWGVGGLAEKNPDNNDEKQVNAVSHMFNSGMNYVETNLWYAQGHAAKLTADALAKSRKSRDQVFIAQVVYGYTATTIKAASKEFDQMRKLFDTDYIDAIEFSASDLATFGYDSIVKFVDRVLSTSKARYFNLTNANLETLKKFHKHYGDKLFAHEVGFNPEVRENEELGITKYADDNNILNVIFQPLRRNRTANHNYPLLVELAEKYNKTQNQIILNWIVSKGFFPLTKSETIAHIDEHIGALDFKIDSADLRRIEEFRAPGYKTPKIIWKREGDGVQIYQLSNLVEDIIEGKV